MNSIISVLVAYNQFLISQIQQLLVFIAKNIPLKSSKYDLQALSTISLLLINCLLLRTLKNSNYMLLLDEYITKHGKELKPIKSRGKNPVPT